jgi:hypothetical protein
MAGVIVSILAGKPEGTAKSASTRTPTTSARCRNLSTALCARCHRSHHQSVNCLITKGRFCMMPKGHGDNWIWNVSVRALARRAPSFLLLISARAGRKIESLEITDGFSNAKPLHLKLSHPKRAGQFPNLRSLLIESCAQLLARQVPLSRRKAQRCQCETFVGEVVLGGPGECAASSRECKDKNYELALSCKPVVAKEDARNNEGIVNVKTGAELFYFCGAGQASTRLPPTAEQVLGERREHTL